MVKERHSRNIPALSEDDMTRLAGSHAAVIGCGGLGGYVVEYLARIGVGSLTVADGDVFTESNLNRQILCTADNIGESKAMAAAGRVKQIDPSVSVVPVCEYLTKENAPVLLAGADIVIDCLDNIESRLVLEDAAADAGITLVHGAISGWDLQAMLVPPGSGLLRALYEGAEEDETKTSLPMTPAACAALEVSLAVGRLCGKEIPAQGVLYAGSLNDPVFTAFDLTSGDR